MRVKFVLINKDLKANNIILPPNYWKIVDICIFKKKVKTHDYCVFLQWSLQDEPILSINQTKITKQNVLGNILSLNLLFEFLILIIIKLYEKSIESSIIFSITN